MARTVILISVAAVWAAFTWWTVRRLWRSPKDPKDAWFAKAAIIAGVAGTIGAALILPLEIPMPPFEYWQLAGYWAISFFPVMLWSAHFGVLMFRAFVDSYYS